MKKRYGLTDQEVNIIAQALENEKAKGFGDNLIVNIGVAKIQEIIDRLTGDGTGDITIRPESEKGDKEA